MDVNSLAHTKWECKYHIVLYRNIGDRLYTNKYEQM